MKTSIFTLGTENYSDSLENCANEVLEYLQENHPEHDFVKLDNVKDKAFEDYIIERIIWNAYIDVDLNSYDIIYLDSIKSDDTETKMILDTLYNYSYYHLVVVNKEYCNNKLRYNLYSRHADKRYTGFDIKKHI